MTEAKKNKASKRAEQKGRTFLLYAGGLVYDMSAQGASVISSEHPVQCNLYKTGSDHVPLWEHELFIRVIS